jgi:hypothetical protein
MAWPEFSWNIIEAFGRFLKTRMSIHVMLNTWNYLIKLSFSKMSLLQGDGSGKCHDL